jgi:hypothetical protein
VVGATIAFYGPNLGQATKVVVGVVPSEHAESELGNWMVKHGDVRSDAAVAGEILEYMEGQGVLSAVLTEVSSAVPTKRDRLRDGEWCPRLRILAPAMSLHRAAHALIVHPPSIAHQGSIQRYACACATLTETNIARSV